jgi:putative ABC transport system permease protein
MSSDYYTYLRLRKGYSWKKLEAKLPQVIDKYIGPQMEKGLGITLKQFRQSGNEIGLYLQPVTDIHLRSDYTNDLEPYGDIRYVYIFSAVALFMLLIACMNFMNLSTASASKRAREVGIRKVMGSAKGQLVRQFLLESILLTLVALLVSICIVYLALPVFNELAGQSLTLDMKTNPWLIPALLLFGLFTGVLAGSYPAFFLSSFNPINVLKGKFTAGKKSGNLRNGLVVFQFFISITLIVGTIVVYKQLSFIQNKKLGYDKDQAMVIQHTYRLGEGQQAFRQQLLRDPRVSHVTASGYLPAGSSNTNNYFAYGDDRPTDLVKTLRYEVDEEYLPTLGIELVAGRNFSAAYGNDSTNIMINETAARVFGWNGKALGHTISHKENDGSTSTYKVVAVVKDFNFRSLHEAITPLVMTLGTDYGTMIARFKTTDIRGLISSMQKQWKAMVPDEPLSYSFLDERVRNSYNTEINIGRILGVFAALTIFVACLGLFGLATFTTHQRTREIGIRKVLGADVTGIVSMLSRQFIKLVCIAFIIAAPLVWFVMNKWLQDFAYRISISWWVFVLSAALVTLLTLVTVSLQAIKAAIANPVKALRTE